MNAPNPSATPNDPTSAEPVAPPSPCARRRFRRLRRLCDILALLLLAYLLLAYWLLPLAWTHYEHHGKMEDAPKTTMLADGIPGDPLNIAFIGTEEELIRAMNAAGWRPADPTTMKTSLRIAASVLRNKKYETAPISNLYLWGRHQDLSFERPAGGSPRQRNHVRFWRRDELGIDGKPLWLGAATFDQSVGMSHNTGQITHHIAPDIDAERDQLIADLTAAGQLTQTFEVTGVGATWTGRNGGGDRYFTDGELAIGQLSPGNIVETAPPTQLPNPALVEWKNQFIGWLNGRGF